MPSLRVGVGGCSKGGQVSQVLSRPRPEQGAIPSAWDLGPKLGTAGPGRKRRWGKSRAELGQVPHAWTRGASIPTTPGAEPGESSQGRTKY